MTNNHIGHNVTVRTPSGNVRGIVGRVSKSGRLVWLVGDRFTAYSSENTWLRA